MRSFRMLQRQIFTECGPIHSSIPAGYQNIVVNMSIFSANAGFSANTTQNSGLGGFPAKACPSENLCVCVSKQA